MTPLYHFTKIQRVPSIMREGLQPVGSCRLVGYLPVVWMTTQHTRRDFAPGWLRDVRKRGWLGSPTWLDDRPLRLVIKPNVPITRWIEWVQQQPSIYRNCDEWFGRRYMSKWWIAFAPISPDCISVGTT